MIHRRFWLRPRALKPFATAVIEGSSCGTRQGGADFEEDTGNAGTKKLYRTGHWSRRGDRVRSGIDRIGCAEQDELAVHRRQSEYRQGVAERAGADPLGRLQGAGRPRSALASDRLQGPDLSAAE